ncbi:MAG: hypothetical protein HYV33_05715 [Candidatus Kerfeldbacteria bacterium]|nr:hypothetical protein [Candidatus Kerfeldbacteria bacterium]
MKKFFVALLLTISWPVVSLAEDAFNLESNTAVRTGYELFGGYVTDLGIDDAGRMYASTLSANGIFSSTDSAATWFGPAAGTDIGKVNALVVADEPNAAYVIGGISLYKTTDGGSTWIELAGSSGDVNANDFNLALAYAGGVVVAPVRDGSVDVSTDEGASFTNITIAPDVFTSSIIGNAAGSKFYILANGTDAEIKTLYVLDVANGTITSTNQSGNYAWVGVNPTDANMIVIAGTDGALYTTTGETGTWQNLTAESVTGEIHFVGDRIYLGDNYTDDLGANLTTLPIHANQLAVDPNAAETILIGSSTGPYLSLDGGDTWENRTTGIVGVTVNDIAQSDNKKTVWLAAQGGLAHSTNFLSAEPTWEYPIIPNNATDIGCVWVNPDNKDHVIAGAGTLYYTTDGGSTWLEASGVNGLTGSFNDVAHDGDTVYAAYSDQSGEVGAVYVSTDSGVSWTSLAGPVAPVNEIGILNNGNLVVAVGHEFNETVTQRGLFIYDGTTWTQQDIATDQAMTSVLVVEETIYAAGIGNPFGKVVRSTDNGVTWEDITDNGVPNDGYFQSLAAEPSTDTVYVATGRPAATGYVYKTTDAGDNWSLLYTGLVDEEFNAMLFDGLTTGTSVGIQSLQSKAKLTLRSSKTAVTIQLKDAATKDVLKNRTIKLYKKNSKHGTWQRVQFVHTKRTNTHGKVNINITRNKTSYYQARWTPSTKDSATYGAAAYRSDQLKIKIK